MHPEHIKLCKEYAVAMDEVNDVSAYLVLVERLNAEVRSLRIALSMSNMKNHQLQDALERNEIF